MRPEGPKYMRLCNGPRQVRGVEPTLRQDEETFGSTAGNDSAEDRDLRSADGEVVILLNKPLCKCQSQKETRQTTFRDILLDLGA